MTCVTSGSWNYLPFWSIEFNPIFCGVRVAHSLFLCVVFYRILLCPFSLCRRFTASGYLYLQTFLNASFSMHGANIKYHANTDTG
jgi:hypothetical protein